MGSGGLSAFLESGGGRLTGRVAVCGALDAGGVLGRHGGALAAAAGLGSVGRHCGKAVLRVLKRGFMEKKGKKQTLRPRI